MKLRSARLEESMLMIMTDNQLLSPQFVCHDCVLANQDGLPRWSHGKLGCGQPGGAIAKDEARSRPTPRLYRCHMGFQVAQID